MLDVGRSCILVTIGGKNIMFDCGMHMGYSDEVSKEMHAISWYTFVLYFVMVYCIMIDLVYFFTF